ncbi:uncharacterized protein CLIB1423_18S02036 [[Candida] railenensis]|uniref:Vacuolar-sorting protein SNF7 n=1 Tax=[Candida] railenensis TaxID=45579 RepID=A0A9P0QTJ3_9ASCO|nr:uncharacterized protein CLIB1423_18S02036 [[Candida] railenensis]
MKIEDEIKSNSFFTPTRLKSLYSDFENLQIINPEGYEANVHAWNDLLVSLLMKGYFAPASSLSIPALSLSQSLSIPQYGKPRALALVLTELVKRHALIPYSHFRSESRSYYELMETTTVRYSDYISPKKWLDWSLSAVFHKEFHAGTSKGGELTPENYIDWNLLVCVGTEVETKLRKMLHSYSSRLYGIEEFSSLLHSLGVVPSLSQIDIDILRTFLSRDRGFLYVISHPEGETYIKVYPNSKEEKFFTEEDIAIIMLKKSIINYENRQAQLDLKLAETNTKIKNLLGKESDKPRVLKLLQTRKLFTKSYERCSNSLLQLEEVLLKMNDATDNVDMMKVLSQSTNALKIINSKVDLGRLDTIIGDLDENTQLTNEISESLGGLVSISDDEIEEEFQNLQRSTHANEQKRLELDKSPHTKQLDRSESDKLISKLRDLEIKPQDHVVEERQNKDSAREEGGHIYNTSEVEAPEHEPLAN